MEHVSVEEEGLGTITKKHPFSLQQQTKLMTDSLLFLQAIGLHVLLVHKTGPQWGIHNLKLCSKASFQVC